MRIKWRPILNLENEPVRSQKSGQGFYDAKNAPAAAIKNGGRVMLWIPLKNSFLSGNQQRPNCSGNFLGINNADRKTG